MTELKSMDDFNVIKNGTVVLDLFATWCGPCKMLEKELALVDTDVAIVRVDVEKFPQVASEYNVTGIPTLLFIKDGKLVNKNVGFTTSQVIWNYIQKM